MKIEEAIQQPKFRNEWHKAAVNLMFTSNWLQDRIKTALKGYEITLQQYNVLRILRGKYPNPISTATIRERMLDKMSDASRIVDRLMKKGWVERNTCKEDKRLVDVCITRSGLDLLARIDEEVGELSKPFSELTEEEARLLNELLDKTRSKK